MINIVELLNQAATLLRKVRKDPEYKENMRSLDPELGLLKATCTIEEVLSSWELLSTTSSSLTGLTKEQAESQIRKLNAQAIAWKVELAKTEVCREKVAAYNHARKH